MSDLSQMIAASLVPVFLGIVAIIAVLLLVAFGVGVVIGHHFF